MDGILGFFNSPIVLTVVVGAFGLLVRFHPGLAKIPNYLIPALSAVLALLIKLTAPGTAQADSTGLDTLVATQGLDTLAVVVAGASGPTLWTKVIASVGQALLNALFYDKFLRTPAVAKFEAPVKKRSHHAGGN